MKYFRQPKIYQNDYIVEIQQRQQMIDLKTWPDPGDPGQKCLVLFFSVRNQVYMLLGREEDDDEKRSHSQVGGDSGSALDRMSRTSSQLANQMKEQDDDSPYFVKITLDSRFLSYLEEPGLVEPSEIPGRTDILVENDVFKDIVRNEVE